MKTICTAFRILDEAKGAAARAPRVVLLHTNVCTNAATHTRAEGRIHGSAEIKTLQSVTATDKHFAIREFFHGCLLG